MKPFIKKETDDDNNFYAFEINNISNDKIKKNKMNFIRLEGMYLKICFW